MGRCTRTTPVPEIWNHYGDDINLAMLKVTCIFLIRVECILCTLYFFGHCNGREVRVNELVSPNKPPLLVTLGELCNLSSVEGSW